MLRKKKLYTSFQCSEKNFRNHFLEDEQSKRKFQAFLSTSDDSANDVSHTPRLSCISLRLHDKKWLQKILKIVRFCFPFISVLILYPQLQVFLLNSSTQNCFLAFLGGFYSRLFLFCPNSLSAAAINIFPIDPFGLLNVEPNSNPLGTKRFVPGISISFKYECYIIMQIQYTKNLKPRNMATHFCLINMNYRTESSELEYSNTFRSSYRHAASRVVILSLVKEAY